nr:hypothetical protein [Tanacetum cinerariifolium]
MEGNFVIPCNVGGLKYMDALVDQGSVVNVMPLSIYNRLTNEKPVGTNITLFIASHSYIFQIGIAEDVLVEIASYVYLIDFMILDVKEDKKKPFILGTPFLTTAKVEISRAFLVGLLERKLPSVWRSILDHPSPHGHKERGNFVTNSREAPSWREIVSLTVLIIMANLLDEPVHPEPALVILDHAPMHLKEDTKEEPKPEPEFAPFVQAIPDNLNGWLEWEGEELEEDEMEVDVEEEIDVDDEDKMDDPEIINPYKDPLN